MLSSASTRFCLYGAFALFLTSSATATVYVRSNASFPEDISAACSSALTADLACSSSITKLRGGLYYPETLLDDLCTSGCSAALATYESDVTTACGDETYDSLDDGYLPMYSIPQVLRYYYDYFCLSDASSGDFCNVLLAESLGIQANQSNLGVFLYLSCHIFSLPFPPPQYACTNPPFLDSIEGGGSLNCTDCDLKQLQFLAGAAYFNDEDIVSEYSSLTSGCSATGYPLTTTTLGYNGCVFSRVLLLFSHIFILYPTSRMYISSYRLLTSQEPRHQPIWSRHQLPPLAPAPLIPSSPEIPASQYPAVRALPPYACWLTMVSLHTVQTFPPQARSASSTLVRRTLFKVMTPARRLQLRTGFTMLRSSPGTPSLISPVAISTRPSASRSVLARPVQFTHPRLLHLRLHRLLAQPRLLLLCPLMPPMDRLQTVHLGTRLWRVTTATLSSCVTGSPWPISLCSIPRSIPSTSTACINIMFQRSSSHT